VDIVQISYASVGPNLLDPIRANEEFIMAKLQKRAAAAESAASKKKKSKVEEDEEEEEEEEVEDDDEEEAGDDEDEEEAEDDDEEEDGGDDDDEEQEDGDDDDDDEDEGQKAWNKTEKKIAAMENEFQAWKKSGGSTSFDHKRQLNICKDAIEDYLSVCAYSGGDDAEAWEERLETLNEEYAALNKKSKKK
jgi:hypothetical protein